MIKITIIIRTALVEQFNYWARMHHSEIPVVRNKQTPGGTVITLQGNIKNIVDFVNLLGYKRIQVTCSEYIVTPY